MAKKIKVNQVKSISSTSLRVRMYVLNNISPDIWVDFIPIVGHQSLEFWYRSGEDPTDENHTAVIPYKSDIIKDGKYTRMYGRIENLTPGIKYHILGTGLGGTSKRYYSAVTIATPTGAESRAMFLILNEEGNFEDFTDCITVPDYKINNKDISEEWEDANYNVHSNTVQTRIQGSVNLRFTSRYRFNRFLACLQYNEAQFGRGRARLQVQVNNEIDLENSISLGSALPNIYEDFFKIEWEPDWAIPFFGTSKDYSGITVNIAEIEE